jgi:hypothetical protein
MAETHTTSPRRLAHIRSLIVSSPFIEKPVAIDDLPSRPVAARLSCFAKAIHDPLVIVVVATIRADSGVARGGELTVLSTVDAHLCVRLRTTLHAGSPWPAAQFRLLKDSPRSRTAAPKDRSE